MDKEMIKKTKFSGSTPPEIFVGRHNYPDIYSGILSPMQYGDTEKFSSPELWFQNQMNIREIADYRNQLLYARFKTNIKKIRQENKLHSAVNQIAMAKSSVAAEFYLEKPAKFMPINEKAVPFIGNPAPLENIRLEENPRIDKKAEYVSNDDKLKAVEGIKTLYKSNISITNIIKMLSAGLLGLKTQRKMVPTRWAITATDDSLSKDMLKQIRLFPEINNFLVFNGEYLGNHYEILLMPDKFSFEVIEMSLNKPGLWHDYELFNGRKTYADSVTGAYYANRLALCEYFLKTKKQAGAIFFREVLPEYNIPLGVGILREVTRNVFEKQPEVCSNLEEAFNLIQTRIKRDFNEYKAQSVLLQEFGRQKRLRQWFN